MTVYVFSTDAIKNIFSPLLSESMNVDFVDMKG